jgi:TB2/DP1, HVA22 family
MHCLLVRSVVAVFLALYSCATNLTPLLIDQFAKVERRFHVSRAWLVAAYAATAFLLLLGIGGWQLIVKLISFVYPAYCSFKAIDTPTPRAGEQWLTYWIIVAFFGLLEPVAGPLLSRIPLYSLWKVGLLLWCYSPEYKGASQVYTQVLRPLVLPHIGLDSRGGWPPAAAVGPRRSRQLSQGVAAAANSGSGSSALVEPEEHARNSSSEPELVVKVRTHIALHSLQSSALCFSSNSNMIARCHMMHVFVAGKAVVANFRANHNTDCHYVACFPNVLLR